MTAAAVLFDMDGLLIDSEPVWYDVEAAAIEQLGGTWAPEHQAALVGGTMDQSCRYMLDLVGSDMPVAELATLLLDGMARRLREHVPLLAGALELLEALAERGVPLGLVTSTYRPLVDAALVAVGVDRFAVIVTGDEVTRGKPAPDPYLLACERLGVAPAAVVVLEDAPHGVTSAEAAGCVVVAVPSVAAIEATPRRPVVSTLADIDVDWLLALA